MTFEGVCEAIRSYTGMLADAATSLGDETQQRSISTLRSDVDTNMYTVVILGEFKRGKSTLLNALIGQNLLPVDVTPSTATINVLRYSDNPFLRIHRSDGTSEGSELNESSLSRFVADSDFDPSSVSYLELGFPSALLDNGMVYVDTPGVDDLNQSRSEITCRFVPRADAVVFLLDATSPVTRSEMDFLEISVLSSGVEKLLFVANFADMVDEQECDTLVSSIQNRLASVLGQDIHNVILVSAKQAIRAVLHEDKEALVKSGLPQIQAKLAELQSSGPGSMSKARQFVRRSDSILADLRTNLVARRGLAKASESDLLQQLKDLEASQAQRAEKRSAIDDWVRDRRNEIIAMARKSLNSFEADLCQEVDDLVMAYRGSDFKDFVDTQIPRLVKRNCKTWIESHTGPINALIDQFDRELTKAIAVEFQTRLQLVNTRQSNQETGLVGDFALSAEDVSKSTLIAGLVAGGAAALMIAMGGPIFIPIIGMAGFPFLRDTFLQKKLEQAKSKLTPQLHQLLADTMERFSNSITGAIDGNMEILKVSANKKYDDLLEMAQELVKGEISARQKDQATVRQDIAKLDEIDRLLCDVEDRLAELKFNESVMMESVK